MGPCLRRHRNGHLEDVPMKKALIVACVAFIAMGAQAHFIDGNQLFANIESQTPAERTFAIGFVTGVVDAAQNEIVCVPDRVTIRQIVDISKTHLQQNPSIRHKPAAYIVLKAVSDVWPCKTKTPTPSGIGLL